MGSWRVYTSRLTSRRREQRSAGSRTGRIKLGCVLPGESPAVFGDALRRLAGGTGDAGELGDGGLGDAELEEMPDHLG